MPPPRGQQTPGSVLVWTSQARTRPRKRSCVTRWVTCPACRYERKDWQRCGEPCL